MRFLCVTLCLALCAYVTLCGALPVRNEVETEQNEDYVSEMESEPLGRFKRQVLTNGKNPCATNYCKLPSGECVPCDGYVFFLLNLDAIDSY